MTKQEHIEYWLQSSKEDLKTAIQLFKTKRYLHCLFFAHLYLEKICKALWVQDHKSNYPPRIHNLIFLLEQSNIELETEQKDFLIIMNDFQMEGRYPDYQTLIYKKCTKKKTQGLFNTVKQIAKWLHSKVQ
ncbi:MAG: HEPN domain-containing protein [Bacteroidia bacterium]|nr:HEPN domain-containing protein [Bacteroidia bacterium]